MIDVARIDYWAAGGSGLLHRASVPAKAVFLTLVVGSAVIAKNPLTLAAVYGTLVLVAFVTGLPWLRMAALSLPAAFFAVIFGLSLRGGPWVYALLVLKAVTPAYAMLILIVSTPYPRIFALLSAVLPEVLAAGLFMTYRSFFILLEMMEHFIASIRLRGGISSGSIAINSSNIAKGIGTLIVRAVERASRLYAVMAVRGYQGSMAESEIGGLKKHDWLPLGTGGFVLAMILVWR